MNLLEKILLVTVAVTVFVYIFFKIKKKVRWSLWRADRMSGGNFERYIYNLFLNLGYKCEITKASGDQGIDIIVKKHLTKTGIQCKCYNKPVGNKAVQEAVAGKKYYSLDKVAVLTNNFFTRSAKELAEINKVELLDRNDLKDLLNEIKNKR